MSGLRLSCKQGPVDLSKLRTKSIPRNSARYRVLPTRIFPANIFGAYPDWSHCELNPAAGRGVGTRYLCTHSLAL
jgi:hypothetical protein